jgi:HAD superfamily hydrolase (TIGR01509 family)
MIKAIFWDNDGILVDTEHLYFLATKQTLAIAGIELKEEQYLDLFLVQSKGAWHLAEEKGISLQEISRLRRERDLLYSKLLGQETLIINGVEEVLKNLHGKYLMGIVTSSQKNHFELIHTTTGFLKYFDFVITNSDYTKSKPDPEPYLLALERSGVKKEECIAIEDSERGLQAAHAAGIRCLVLPGKLTKKGNFEKAHKVLNNIGEVLSELGV